MSKPRRRAAARTPRRPADNPNGQDASAAIANPLAAIADRKPKGTFLSHEALMELGRSEHVTYAETESRAGARFLGQLFVAEPGGQVTVLIKREGGGPGKQPVEQLMNVEDLAPHEVMAFFDCLAALIERARADRLLPHAAEIVYAMARRHHSSV